MVNPIPHRRPCTPPVSFLFHAFFFLLIHQPCQSQRKRVQYSPYIQNPQTVILNRSPNSPDVHLQGGQQTGPVRPSLPSNPNHSCLLHPKRYHSNSRLYRRRSHRRMFRSNQNQNLPYRSIPILNHQNRNHRASLVQLRSNVELQRRPW